jgi:cysteine desulfurase
MKRIYLDYAATTPCDPQVIEAMAPYFFEKFGNPSSIHSFGQETRAGIDQARDTIAAFIGAQSAEIIFTSGGTEADNLALKGVAYANQNKGNHIITTQIEHHAVLETAKFLEKQGFAVTYVPVDKFGMVNPQDIEQAITDKTILISVMHANNEVGTIEPIEEIGETVKRLNQARKNKIYFHTDAVQTLGHIPVNVNDLGVDLLSMSAHKLYGPKGVGALYVRKGTRIQPIQHGGEQERGKRASTENVPGIVGFGKAVELAKRDTLAHRSPPQADEGGNNEIRTTIQLRDKLIAGIMEKIEDVELNGHPTLRLPNNVSVAIRYIEGESILLNLDLQGVAASTGSACSSGSLEPSHVMLALGLSHERSHGTIRFSLGKYTTEEDIDYVLTILPEIVTKLRLLSPLYKTK